MKRNIVSIDSEKCNGCGLCAQACHEGAIEMRDGKAVLISDEYCDGLGACLPECPVGAIEIIEREAVAFDEEAVKAKMERESKKGHEHEKMACGCPGSMQREIKRESVVKEHLGLENAVSELRNWPVQLRLINSGAQYLEGADLLIASDCSAFACGNFHEIIQGKVTIIACPKLDDNEFNRDKIAEILQRNKINSITVARMSVPCCSALVHAVKQAMIKTEIIVPFSIVTIDIDGSILES